MLSLEYLLYSIEIFTSAHFAVCNYGKVTENHLVLQVTDMRAFVQYDKILDAWSHTAQTWFSVNIGLQHFENPYWDYIK